MVKISDKGVPHHPGRFSVRWQRHYDRIPHGADDRHPVDMAVDGCMDDNVTKAQIVRQQERLLSVLGKETALYLDLEATINEHRRERERCFFDLGYEHGSIERLAQMRRGILSLSTDADALAREVRGHLIHTKAPSAEAILVLLECVWALMRNQQE